VRVAIEVRNNYYVDSTHIVGREVNVAVNVFNLLSILQDQTC